MGVEPEDFARTCDKLLPLSELRKHIASCKEKQKCLRRSLRVKGGDHPVTSTDFEEGNTDCVEMLVNTMLYI